MTSGGFFILLLAVACVAAAASGVAFVLRRYRRDLQRIDDRFTALGTSTDGGTSAIRSIRDAVDGLDREQTSLAERIQAAGTQIVKLERRIAEIERGRETAARTGETGPARSEERPAARAPVRPEREVGGAPDDLVSLYNAAVRDSSRRSELEQSFRTMAMGIRDFERWRVDTTVPPEFVENPDGGLRAVRWQSPQGDRLIAFPPPEPFPGFSVRTLAIAHLFDIVNSDTLRLVEEGRSGRLSLEIIEPPVLSPAGANAWKVSRKGRANLDFHA